MQPGAESLAGIVERDLERVRTDRPLTGVTGAFATFLSVVFTLFWMLFLSTLMAVAGFLLTESGWGAVLFAGGAVVVVGLIRHRNPLKSWRHVIQANGFDIDVAPGVTEVHLRVTGPVRVAYRFAPKADVIERLHIRSTPSLPPTLSGVVHTLRLGAPLFDGGLDLTGAPLHLACITGPERATLTAVGRPLEFRASRLQFALDRDALGVPTDVFDALAEAVAGLAVDMADPTPALQRISAEDGSDIAFFDAARASAVLLADGIVPNARPVVLAAVRACIAGDFDALIATPLRSASRTAICRGAFRAAAITDGAFDRLCVGAQGLPDTEAGCIDAIGVLGALESPEALARFERLAEIGSMSAAHWLGDAEFPTAHGLQAAADAARAALHARLHVHGALSIGAADGGGVSLIETGANVP